MLSSSKSCMVSIFFVVIINLAGVVSADSERKCVSALELLNFFGNASSTPCDDNAAYVKQRMFGSELSDTNGAYD